MRSIKHSLLLLLTITAVNCADAEPEETQTQKKEYVILGYDIQQVPQQKEQDQEVGHSFLEAYIAPASFKVHEVFKFVLKNGPAQNGSQKWRSLRLFCLGTDGGYHYMGGEIAGDEKVKNYMEDNMEDEKTFLNFNAKSDKEDENKSDRTFSQKIENLPYLLSPEDISKFLEEGIEKDQVISNRERERHCATIDMLYHKKKKAVLCKNTVQGTSNNNEGPLFLIKELGSIGVQSPEDEQPIFPPPPPQQKKPTEEIPTPKEDAGISDYTLAALFIGLIVGSIVGYILKPDSKKKHKKNTSHKKVKIESKSPVIISGDQIEVKE